MKTQGQQAAPRAGRGEAKSGKSMLELYHTVNSVCAQKVRVALAEKSLDWQSHLMTLRGDQFTDSYLKLNPNAVVPTLLHDGQPIIESSVILYYLEECFPGVRLMPLDPRARATVRLFNKLIDEYVHNACTVLTFAIAYRSRFQKMEPAALENYLNNSPNQKRSNHKRDVIVHGLDSKFCAEAAEYFTKLLAWIEQATLERNYLAGDEFSLADIAVIPYVIRLDMLRLSPMWDAHSGMLKWYERLCNRHSVEQSIIGSMTPVDKAPFMDIDVDPWPAMSRLLDKN
jgi:glutathione S-transferase